MAETLNPYNAGLMRDLASDYAYALALMLDMLTDENLTNVAKISALAHVEHPQIDADENCEFEPCTLLRRAVRDAWERRSA